MSLLPNNHRRTLLALAVCGSGGVTLTLIMLATLNGPARTPPAAVVPGTPAPRAVSARTLPIVTNRRNDAPASRSQSLVSALHDKERCTALLRAWTHDDPAAAASWVLALPAGETRSTLLGHVAIVWANLDLATAAAWAEGLPASAPADRTIALQAIANEALRTDALVTLRLMTPQPTGSDRDTLLRRAAMELAVDDADALASWAEALAPGALRDEILSGIALVWSDRNPCQAAIIAGGDLPEGRLRDDTLVGIAQRWVQTDAAQAAAWVQTWPDSESRHAAVENVALAWARQDDVAATRWLDGLVRQAGASPPSVN